MQLGTRELVVDRSVLVYAPPLRERVGSRLGPVQLFAELDPLWEVAGASIERNRVRQSGAPVRIRVFPQGGLTYVPVRQGTRQ